MKKLLLSASLSILLSAYGFGQVTNYNFTFEPGTTQGAWNFFENGSNTAGLTFVANPFPGGINTSETVAKFTAAADGGEWAGCESIFGTLGKWKFDGSNPTTVTVDVYKSSTAPVDLKFTSTNANGQGTVFFGSQVPSAINQWVTLTYVVDFSTLGGEDNADNNAGTNQVVLHVDQVTPRTADQNVYFDNIKFTATKLADPILPPEPAAAPTVAAPAPTANASEILSIFSDVYTNLAGTNFNPNWGQTTKTTQVPIAGNNTLKYEGLTYQGTNLGSIDGTSQNLTTMKYMHLDYWTPDATLPLKVTLVSKTTGEKAYTCSPLIKDTWVSVEIPLTHFTGLGLGVSDIYQLKMEGNGTVYNGTWYLDNIFFSSGSMTAIAHPKSARVDVYPNPVKNDLYITTNTTFNKAAIYNAAGKLVKEYGKVINSVNVNDLKAGIYIIRLTDANGKTVYSKFVKE